MGADIDQGGGSRGILLRVAGEEYHSWLLLDGPEGRGAWLRPWIAGSKLQILPLASWCLGQVAAFLQALISLSVRCDEQGARTVPAR